MKSTLADIRQLFNVKNIAYETTMDDLAEGDFGIFAEDSNTSIASGTTYATLPDRFRIVSKLNGKVYFSFDIIEKARIFNQAAKDYQAPDIDIWEAVIQHCNCMNGVTLNIGLNEQSLIQRDGLTWTHRDFVVVVSPQELLCYCSCDGSKPTYENNIITQLLVEKIVAINSPFYTAEATVDVSGLTTYADQAALDAAVPAPNQGDMAIVTGVGLRVYDGSAWVTLGTVAGVLTDIAAFVAVFKDVNTDDDTANDGPLLTLVVKGKPTPAPLYHDLEVNYVYPRGVKLAPALTINGEKSIEFTQTQALVYEIGAGYDLRAEEFESMSLYTDLNHYPRLSDGIQSQNLVYQFENNTNYNTITLEFGSKKSGLEDVPEGDYKKFGILFGIEDAGAYGELVDIFIP